VNQNPHPADLLPGLKPCIRQHLILQHINLSPINVDIKPYIEEMNAIQKGVLNRLNEAIRFETADPPEAARLYEALVEDACLIPHIYIWLTRYYQRQDEPAHVVRVCQTFVSTYKDCETMQISFPEYLPFLHYFIDLLENAESVNISA
jgi:hypothetical protein